MDDPNTFELVARNLKMKARGNQKSNEASQIKSSPHNTENHQKIVKNEFNNDFNDDSKNMFHKDFNADFNNAYNKDFNNVGDPENLWPET